MESKGCKGFRALRAGKASRGFRVSKDCKAPRGARVRKVGRGSKVSRQPGLKASKDCRGKVRKGLRALRAMTGFKALRGLKGR